MLTQTTQVTEFLANNGLLPDYLRPDTAGNIRIPCFDQCANEGKDKKNLSVNTITGSFQCFRCGFAGQYAKLKRRFEPPTPEQYALDRAQDLFKSNLMEVVDSLQDRGFTHEFLLKVGIGYAPPGYASELTSIDQVSAQTLLKVGLLSEVVDANGTRLVETLADRITIPFYSADGELYTFKARVHMDDHREDRKYVTLTGTKWSGPYNERALHMQQGEVVVCEGEFDALTLIQYGFNAVGLPGASSFHADWFKDVSVTFVFDNDTAGHNGLKKATQAIAECKALFLPEGTDVNSFVVARGIEAFKTMLATADTYSDGKKEESDHLAHRLSEFDDWAHANNARIGAETGFSTLTNSIDGWQEGLIVLPAAPNIGKSSLMLQLSVQAVELNKDVVVGYASIDDSERTTLTKIIAFKADITYDQAAKPRSELSSSDLSKNHPELLQRRKNALKTLSELADRLIIRDVRFGRTLKQFERWVKKLRKSHKDKRLIVFIDSFDKMLMSDSAVQNTDSKGALIQEIKRITTEQHCTIVTSVEIRKIGEKRPTLSDIKDTIQVEYECDVAISLYQAYHHDQQTELFFLDEHNKRRPIFEAWVLKNKMSGFKGGPLLFYFHTDKSLFIQIPQDHYQHYKALVFKDINQKEDKGKGKNR